ncbi:g10485 [Coccomyxa elongata]
MSSRRKTVVSLELLIPGEQPTPGMPSRQRSGGSLLGPLDDFNGQVVRPRSTSSSFAQDSQTRSYVYLRYLVAISLLGMILLMVAGHHERNKAATANIHFFRRRDLAASTPAPGPVTAPAPAPARGPLTPSQALNIGAVGYRPTKPALEVVVPRAPAPAPSAKAAPKKQKAGAAGALALAPAKAAPKKMKETSLLGMAPAPGPAAGKVRKAGTGRKEKAGAPAHAPSHAKAHTPALAPGPARGAAVKRAAGVKGTFATAPAFAPAPGLGGAAAAFLAPAPRGARSRRGDADKIVSSYSVGGVSAPVAAPKLASIAAPNLAPVAAPKLAPVAAPSKGPRKRAAAPAPAPGPARAAAGQLGSGFTTLGSIFG